MAEVCKRCGGRGHVQANAVVRYGHPVPCPSCCPWWSREDHPIVVNVRWGDPWAIAMVQAAELDARPSPPKSDDRAREARRICPECWGQGYDDRPVRGACERCGGDGTLPSSENQRSGS